MQTTEGLAHAHVSERPLRIMIVALLLGFSACPLRCVRAQEIEEEAATPDQPAMIQLTFPQEMELKILIDFVSQRLGIQFLYDEAVADKRISVKSPQPIPADTLLGVLESALKMKGLALVDAEVKGWKRIVLADDLPRIAVPQEKDQPIEDFPGTTAVTQTFTLTHITPERVSAILEPFLTRQGANTITLPSQNMLIVTDYADNLRRIARLVETIDQAGPERILKFYQVKHVAATGLSQQITQSLVARTTGQPAGITPLNISHDERTNQLLIVGTQQQISAAMQLAESLDVSLDQRTQIYAFQYIGAERIDQLVKDIFDPLTIERLYRSAVDRDDNLLIATATDEIHERIEWLRKEMDLETKRPGSAVQFYRLKYADAEEVLQTLRAVEQRGGGPAPFGYRRGISPLGRGLIGPARSVGPRESPIDFVPGPNRPGQPGEVSPAPPALREGTPADERSELIRPDMTRVPGMATIVPGAARVSVDPNSNAIIVIADRAVQQVYADLIRALDRRRPQVMIEAKVVILDTTDDFSLGIEFSNGDREGVRRLLKFTSFGLSQVDPVNGALALIPGRGLNWTLVDPNGADIVLRALVSHRRAKVTSAPRILVNDNATGTLASVTEVPFTSVNASNTVATTSFAGFAEAGTTIEVRPRITDDDHLQLDYIITLNSFTGEGGQGVPPPRQTDQVASNITVPDGYTVIVGGLTRRNVSRTRDGVPFWENIPIVKELTSIHGKSDSQTTLFIFLRPIILRDDKFRDLKYLSDRDLPRATEPGNYPTSTALLIRSGAADFADVRRLTPVRDDFDGFERPTTIERRRTDADR